MLILIEGQDGVGKTTLIKRLNESLQRDFDGHVKTIYNVSEPFHEVVNNDQKENLLHLNPTAKALLMASQRIEMYSKYINNVCHKSDIIISDRSFISSLAYDVYYRYFVTEDIFILESALEEFKTFNNVFLNKYLSNLQKHIVVIHLTGSVSFIKKNLETRDKTVVDKTVIKLLDQSYYKALNYAQEEFSLDVHTINNENQDLNHDIIDMIIAHKLDANKH